MYKSMRIGLPLPDTLWRHWKKSMPDVVYISTEGPLGFAALLTAKKLSIPVVSGFHTNFDYYTRFYHLAVIEKMVMRYLRFFHSRSGQTLVPTEQLKKQLLNKGIQNTIVSPRGIDIERFNPDYHNLALRRHWGVTADGLAVILVGRLAAEKNLDLAVRAFRKIQKIKPESRFILVGDGPLAGAIKKENPDFIFAGQKTGEELATHYASADLFLFPSQSETFGNVVLEALASGLPVVGYDYAAAAEHVVSGSNGFKAPFDQEGAFILAAEKAAHAAKNSQLKVMSKQARRSVETESWERLLERFESILIEESHYDEHLATAW